MLIRYFKYYPHSILQHHKDVAGVVYIILFVFLILVGCKKTPLAEQEQPESPLTGTRTQLTLDSVFLYARQVYLWNETLPDYQTFSPRKYAGNADELQGLKSELFDISQYAINSLSNRPYEYSSFPGVAKYSLLRDGSSDRGFFAAMRSSSTSTDLYFAISGDRGYLKLTEFKDLTVLGDVLDQAFSTFADSGVVQLAIDLRDNSGGYVETAQYLANLLATPQINGKIMFSQHFNMRMQQGNAPILKNQLYLDENGRPVYIHGRKATYADVDFSIAGNTFKFEKKGQFETLKSLCFIVNGNTASASELLINALLPYFDVTLIGSRTYGKPVGSFGIKIGRYMLYAANFHIKNANGSGDYFEGMVPDVAVSDEEIGTSTTEILANIPSLILRKRVVNNSAKRLESLKNSGKNEVMIRTQLRLKQ